MVKDAMHKLRKLLDDLGMVKGLRREEKDPEEFINLVLDNVFKVPPSLQLRYVLINISLTRNWKRLTFKSHIVDRERNITRW